MNRPGGTLNSGNNFCHTLLDDSGPSSIQNITPGGNPWAGTFKPANPLAAFNGENPNGTWTLNVSDNALADTGSVRAFSLNIAPTVITCTAGCAASLNSAGSSLVNESCPAPNGAIDPGETATVNLNISNTGGASTANLVATLQSSANVLAPSGPQTYGAIVPGTTVGRNFTFTADEPAAAPSVDVAPSGRC
jgi:hypothetical protein